MEELSELERDTISEVGNISLGSSATALSTILSRGVNITTPRLEVIDLEEIGRSYPIPCLVVDVEYISGLQGSNILIIKESDALIISAIMMGEPYEGREGPLDEIGQSAVQEAMNQMMGSMATSMSELFQRPVDISPPQVFSCEKPTENRVFEQYSPSQRFVRVEFTMTVEDIFESIMVQLIPVEFARDIAAQLLSQEPGATPVPDIQEPPGTGVATGPAGPATRVSPPSPPAGEAVAGEYGLSDLEKDTIAEVGNISLGSSATALSTILGKGVEITTPRLSLVKISEIQDKYPIPCLLVEVDYVTGLEGSNLLLVKQEDALVIAALMMGEYYEGREGKLSEIEMSAVQEAMNQMMGSMATAMSELFQRAIDISPPRVEFIDLGDERLMLAGEDPEALVVHVEFNIRVEDVIDSVMFQVIPLGFARSMANYLLFGDAAPPVAEPVQAEPPAAETGPVVVEKSFGEPLEEAPYFEEPPVDPFPAPARTFPGVPGKGLDIDLQKLELVRDIPMDITVVLGSARLPLGRLFSLDRGGIVDLDCSENDPVELLANDRLLARGELVMINEQLGVRITEIQLEQVIDSYGL